MLFTSIYVSIFYLYEHNYCIWMYIYIDMYRNKNLHSSLLDVSCPTSHEFDMEHGGHIYECRFRSKRKENGMIETLSYLDS